MKQPQKPNLIYVFADQLRYSSVGYNGDSFAYTPNLDKLAEQSLSLDNAVSGHPVCAPYRASLLTGKYTTSTGMVINEIRLNAKAHKTFARILNDEGYNTEYIGKWHLYADELGNHYDPKNSYIPEGENRLGFDRCFIGYNFHHEYYAPKAYYHENSPEKIGVEGYEPDCQTDIAIEHLKALAKEDKPFAFFLSLGTPHDPWSKENVPQEYYDMFKNTQFPTPPNYKKHNDLRGDFPWTHFLPNERKKLNGWKQVYYSMVANLDYNIGRLQAAIKEAGLDKNTIFVFTSDHGEMFGAQGRRGKNIFYDEAIKVPFLVHYDKIEKGKYTGVVNTVDIMPTLLSIMQIAVPDFVEGADKSANIIGRKKEDETDGALLMGTGATAIWGNGYEWRGWRTERFTYAVYRLGKKELFFDNINDPFQTKNLIDDPSFAAVIKTIKNKMYAEMQRVGDDFEKNSFYKKYWVEERRIKERLPRRKDLKKQ